VNLQRQQRMQI